MTVEILRIHEYYLTATTTAGTKFSKPVEEMSKDELSYTSVRKKDGTYHKSSSMKSGRATIDRSLRSLPHNKQMDEKKHYQRLRI